MAKRRKKTNKVRRRSRRSIGFGASSMLMDVLGVTAGAVIAKKIPKMLPNMDAKITNAAAVVAGVVAPKFIKNPLVAAVGQGMIAVGGVGLVGSFLPALGAADEVLILSGTDDINTVNGIDEISTVNGLDEIGNIDDLEM